MYEIFVNTNVPASIPLCYEQPVMYIKSFQFNIHAEIPDSYAELKIYTVTKLDYVYYTHEGIGYEDLKDITFDLIKRDVLILEKTTDYSIKFENHPYSTLIFIYTPKSDINYLNCDLIPLQSGLSYDNCIKLIMELEQVNEEKAINIFDEFSISYKLKNNVSES